jgi:hypothetical protein
MLDTSHTLTALDLYVAGTMHRMPDRDARLRRAGSSFEAAREMVDAVRSTPVADVRSCTRAAVIDVFGMPLRAEDRQLVYALRLWPAHHYVWGFHERGFCVGMGMVATGSPRALGVPPTDLVAVGGALRVGSDTEDEVRGWLGDADPVDRETTDWWPEATRYYGSDGPGPMLELTFEHNLLASVTVRNPPP